MTWSARLWVAALLATLNLSVMGCSAHVSWPTTVGAQGDGGFMSQRLRVRTVDILPMDIQVWDDGQTGLSSEQLSAAFASAASGTTTAALARRGYQVVANVDWSGDFMAPDGRPAVAMTEHDVALTMHAMSGYGYAVAQANQGLLVPHLPARLGERTGADTTLYVGGWAYVGDEPGPSTGEKVATGVVIGLFVVVIAVVAIAGLKSSGKSVGGVAGGAGRAVGTAASTAGRAVADMGHAAARVAGPVLRGVTEIGVEVTRGALQVADCLGRSGTHIEIYAGRPDYHERDTTPKAGPSQMYLEMTLIDNGGGKALWHARHSFPADATRQDQVDKAFALMMSTLPGA